LTEDSVRALSVTCGMSFYEEFPMDKASKRKSLFDLLHLLGMLGIKIEQGKRLEVIIRFPRKK